MLFNSASQINIYYSQSYRSSEVLEFGCEYSIRFKTHFIRERKKLYLVWEREKWKLAVSRNPTLFMTGTIQQKEFDDKWQKSISYYSNQNYRITILLWLITNFLAEKIGNYSRKCFPQCIAFFDWRIYLYN